MGIPCFFLPLLLNSHLFCILTFFFIATALSYDYLFVHAQWNAAAFGIGLDNLGLYEISLASPGFGASANSFMDFVNVDEGNVYFGMLDNNENNEHNNNENNNKDTIDERYMSNPNGIGSVHRSKDSGSGSYTPYHSRKAQANTKIQPYSELFVSYGSKWFIAVSYTHLTLPTKDGV